MHFDVMRQMSSLIPSLSHFCSLVCVQYNLLPCIILNANQRTTTTTTATTERKKNGGSLGTRLTNERKVKASSRLVTEN